MRKLFLALAILTAAPVWALEGPAPGAAAGTAPAASQTGNGKSVHLGKIEVTGVKPLVEFLQEIKVAVKRPFDNDPAHFDDMVCRLGDDQLGSHMSSTLECGTQGWFSMRRNVFGYGGLLQSGQATVSTLGHPWHVVRQLTSGQEKNLRDLMRELPPPGQGDVPVIEDKQHAPLEPSH